jgi:hypothetical protein
MFWPTQQYSPIGWTSCPGTQRDGHRNLQLGARHSCFHSRGIKSFVHRQSVRDRPRAVIRQSDLRLEMTCVSCDAAGAISKPSSTKAPARCGPDRRLRHLACESFDHRQAQKTRFAPHNPIIAATIGNIHVRIRLAPRSTIPVSGTKTGLPSGPNSMCPSPPRIWGFQRRRRSRTVSGVNVSGIEAALRKRVCAWGTCRSLDPNRPRAP